MQHRLTLLARGDPNVRADDPEPALCDLLGDPVLELVLKSDRVRPAELHGVIERAQARLGHGFPSCRADGPAIRIDCLV